MPPPLRVRSVGLDFQPGDHLCAFYNGDMEATAKGTLSEGYERLWLIGDTTVVIRNPIDLKAWFAAEYYIPKGQFLGGR